MNQQERLNQVLELVAARGSVKIEEVSEALQVSPATIRRDLNELAEQQLVVRTHGGASILSTGYELPLRYKLPQNAEAKAAIAACIESMVEVGGSVALNGGTTTSEIARAFARSRRLATQAEEPALTIVTNAVNIAYELTRRQQFRLIVTGGVVRPRSYELVSTLVQATLSEFTVDLAVLGVDGLSVASGATTLTQDEALVGRWMSECAKRVVVAADHTKLGIETLARLLPIEKVDVLVTDAAADPRYLDLLREAGVEVEVAGRVS